MNEPLPGQLTLGRLRQLLDGVHDQAVVVLRICETLDAPPPLQSVLTNLKVARVGPGVVILEIDPEPSVAPPDPDR